MDGYTYMVWIFVIVQTGMAKACSGTAMLLARSGELLSPNYPGDYDDNLGCTWEIQSPNGGRIVLDVHVFNLEVQSNCGFDSITIYDGTGNNNKTFMRKACGRELENKTLVTPSKAITLYFKTDGSQVRKGFNITWSTCGGNFVDQKDTVTSQEMQFYHEPENFTYNLMVPVKMSAIQVNFSNSVFDSFIGDCLIQISDSRNKYVGQLCTRSDAKVYVFNTNEIKLTFTSIYGSRAVMNVTFNEYERTITPCPKRITTAQYGNIFSPGFPGNYGDDLYCTWEIQAANQGRIMLTFHEFDIEYDKDCTFDFITIYDGSIGEKIMVDKACGTELRMKTVITITSVVVVVFKTDLNVNGKGFNITWESCGGNFITQSYDVILPKFNYYPEPITCRYSLMVSENTSIIELDVSDVQPDTIYGICLIKISDSKKKYLGQICTNSDPRIYAFNTRELQLDCTLIYSHNTDVKISVREFEGELESCDRSFTTARTGTINYYFKEKPNLLCTWEISLSNIGQIALNFQDFNIGNDMNCSTEFLTIYEGPTDNTRILVNSKCGSSMANEVVTSSFGRVVVVLKTGYYVNRRGFRVSWQSCDFGKYGYDCKYECVGNCLNGVTCNILTGHCDDGCISGWEGDKCDIGVSCGESTRMVTIIGISSLIVILLLSVAVLVLCFRLKRVNHLQTIRDGNGEFAMRDRETQNEVYEVYENYENQVDSQEHLEVYENVKGEVRGTNPVRGKGVVSNDIDVDEIYEEIS